MPSGSHSPDCFKTPLVAARLQRQSAQSSASRGAGKPPARAAKQPDQRDQRRRAKQQGARHRAKMAESLADTELEAAKIAACQAQHIDDPDRVQTLQQALERCNIASAKIEASIVESFSASNSSGDGVCSAPPSCVSNDASDTPGPSAPSALASTSARTHAYISPIMSRPQYHHTSAARLIQLAAVLAAASAAGPLTAAATIPAVMCAPRIAEHIAGLATSPDSSTLRKLPPAPPGKKWYSSALDTGASINCWNIASVFDRLATSKILLETADGNRLDIDKIGTGSIRALDTIGKPRTLSFGKALFSPKVHNLLSPGAMFEAGTITDIHLHPTGGHVRLCDGTKIPLRAHARLY